MSDQAKRTLLHNAMLENANDLNAASSSVNPIADKLQRSRAWATEHKDKMPEQYVAAIVECSAAVDQALSLLVEAMNVAIRAAAPAGQEAKPNG